MLYNCKGGIYVRNTAKKFSDYIEWLHFCLLDLRLRLIGVAPALAYVRDVSIIPQSCLCLKSSQRYQILITLRAGSAG